MTIELLNKILANTYSVYLKTQNYHWNVKGINFHQLHLFFEDQYKELAEAVDTLAERLRALDQIAPGGFEDFIELRSLKDGNSSYTWDIMIQDLISDHLDIVKDLSDLVNLCDDDEATADLAVERLRIHEKTIWMLRSILD